MDQRWRSLGIVVFTAAMLGGAALRSAEAKILAQWVQLGPDGSSSVRAIADDACPSVIFDGIAVPMRVRSDPAQKFGGVKPAQFLVLGCEVAVPAGSVAAVLDGKPQHASPAKNKRSSSCPSRARHVAISGGPFG